MFGGDRLSIPGRGLVPITPAMVVGAQRLGSEWCEAVITAGVQGFGGPPHGHPSRWDWGVTLKSLGYALARNDHMQRLARNLTPEQLEALWTDPSWEAAALRDFMRKAPK